MPAAPEFVRRAILHRRDAKGSTLRLAWFRNPDATDRSGLGSHGQSRGKLETLKWREALHSIHPSGLLPAIVLRDFPDGEQLGGLGLHQQALQPMNCSCIATL
jgi:hypothetical protein